MSSCSNSRRRPHLRDCDRDVHGRDGHVCDRGRDYGHGRGDGLRDCGYVRNRFLLPSDNVLLLDAEFSFRSD